MNAQKDKEVEKDWLEIFALIDEEEIKRAENQVYFIKMPKIKASDKRVVYCEGMWLLVLLSVELIEYRSD